MGHDGIWILLLWISSHLVSVASDCSGPYNPFTQYKGLKALTPAPHKSGQQVEYKCAGYRQVPGFTSIQSTCIGNNHVGRSDLPECECSQTVKLDCEEARFYISYSASQTSSISISVPDLLSASKWTVKVLLSFSDLNSSVFDMAASGDWRLDTITGLLTMQHSPQTPLPSDGLLWVNSSVRVGTAISVNRWHYPCIQDITCILVSPNSLSHTVSFVLSSIFLVFVLLLMISLKICHWKAAKNDKLLRKKLRGKGDSSQIVQTVPAVDQHCRMNMVDVRDKYIDTQDRVDERLQYSYNARTPPSNNSSRHANPKTPPLQWNSYQQQQLHHHKNHHHHQGGHSQDHSHDKLREQYTREALSQYNSGSTFQSRHKHRHHHRKANSDSMAEAWRTANSY